MGKRITACFYFLYLFFFLVLTQSVFSWRGRLAAVAGNTEKLYLIDTFTAVMVIIFLSYAITIIVWQWNLSQRIKTEIISLSLLRLFFWTAVFISYGKNWPDSWSALLKQEYPAPIIAFVFFACVFFDIYLLSYYSVVEPPSYRWDETLGGCFKKT